MISTKRDNDIQICIFGPEACRLKPLKSIEVAAVN